LPDATSDRAFIDPLSVGIEQRKFAARLVQAAPEP